MTIPIFEFDVYIENSLKWWSIFRKSIYLHRITSNILQAQLKNKIKIWLLKAQNFKPAFKYFRSLNSF